MIRRHPLLILLLLATTVVDVTLIWRIGWHFTARTVFSGLVLGQTGALALWAVWGQGHRLARVSTMVVATGLIALATGRTALLGPAQWLAILSVYTFIVYLGTLLLAAGQSYAERNREQESDRSAWQVSLIELFGWTILVAIASFAARSMDFVFLKTNTLIPLRVGLIVMAPLALAAGIRKGLTGLTSSKLYWLGFAALIPVGTIALRYYEPRTAVPLILGQTGYLLIWLLVLLLDRRTLDSTASEDTPPEETERLDNESGQLDA